MSEDDPTFVGSKLEKSPVVCSGQRSILGPYDVKIGDLPPESTEDTTVEILISQEAQHRRYRPSRARSRSRKPVWGEWASISRRIASARARRSRR